MEQKPDIPLEQITGAITHHREAILAKPHAQVELRGLQEKSKIDAAREQEPGKEELTGEREEQRQRLLPYLEMIRGNVHQKMIEHICTEPEMIRVMKDTANRRGVARAFDELILKDNYLSILNTVATNDQRRFIIDAFFVLNRTNEVGFEAFIDAGINARVIDTKGAMSLIFLTDTEAVKLMLDHDVISGAQIPTNERKRHQLAHKARLLREITAGLELQHPNILGIKRPIMKEGADINNANIDMFAGYSMEIIDGMDLDDIALHELPAQYRDWIFLQIIRGVAFAHAKGFFHRDLKPGNVMFAKNKPLDEQIKVIDFGLVRSDDASEIKMPQVTKPGVPIGTPYYMSREQWIGQPEKRSDVYALGIMLYEAITGRVPYDFPANAGPFDIASTVIMGKPNLQYGTNAPSEMVQEIIQKATSKALSGRYPDAEQMYYHFYLAYMREYHPLSEIAEYAEDGNFELPPIPDIAIQMHKHFTGDTQDEALAQTLDKPVDPQGIEKDTMVEAAESLSIEGTRKAKLLAYLIAHYREKYGNSRAVPRVGDQANSSEKSTHRFPADYEVLSEHSFDTRLWKVTDGELVLKVPMGEENIPIIKLTKGALIGKGELEALIRGQLILTAGETNINNAIDNTPALIDVRSNQLSALRKRSNVGDLQGLVGYLHDNDYQNIGQAVDALDYHAASLNAGQVRLRRVLHREIRNSLQSPVTTGVALLDANTMSQEEQSMVQAENFTQNILIPALLQELRSILHTFQKDGLEADIIESGIQQLAQTFPNAEALEEEFRQMIPEINNELSQLQFAEQSHQFKSIEYLESAHESKMMEIVYCVGPLLEPTILTSYFGNDGPAICKVLEQKGYLTGVYPYVFLTLQGKEYGDALCDIDEYADAFKYMISLYLYSGDLYHCEKAIEHINQAKPQALGYLIGDPLFKAIIQQTIAQSSSLSVDLKIKLYSQCYEYVAHDKEISKPLLAELNGLLIQTGDYIQAREVSHQYFKQFIEEAATAEVLEDQSLNMLTQYYDTLVRLNDWDRLQRVQEELRRAESGNPYNDIQLKKLRELFKDHAQFGIDAKGKGGDDRLQIVQAFLKRLESDSDLNLVLSSPLVKTQVKRNFYLMLQRLCAWSPPDREKGISYGTEAIAKLADNLDKQLMQALIVNLGVVGRILEQFENAMQHLDQGGINPDSSINEIGQMYRLTNMSEMVDMVRKKMIKCDDKPENIHKTLTGLRSVLVELDKRGLIPSHLENEGSPSAQHTLSRISQIVQVIDSGSLYDNEARQQSMDDINFLLLELRLHISGLAHEYASHSRTSDQMLLAYGNMIQTMFEKMRWLDRTKREGYAAYFSTDENMNYMPEYFTKIIELYSEVDKLFQKKLDKTFKEIQPLPYVVGLTLIGERIKFLNTVEFMLSEWERESDRNKEYVIDTRKKLKLQIKTLIEVYKPIIDTDPEFRKIAQLEIEFPNRAFGILEERLEAYGSDSTEHHTQAFMIQTMAQALQEREVPLGGTAAY